MFSGIISAIGKVVKYDGDRLGIRTPFRQIKRGESISVDGVCLTVVRQTGRTIFFDVGPETRRITTLGRIRPGFPVNLERALRWGDRLGGHWVTGHVEQTGRIERITAEGKNRWFTIALPVAVARYVVPKGSMTVDGISLTAAGVKKHRVQIMVIPHTLAKTTLGAKRVGDRVNLEPDHLAKFLLHRRHSPRS